MTTIYTSRVGYRGADGLDITVKSATGIGSAARADLGDGRRGEGLARLSGTDT